MNKLINTPIDQKNIGLAKILYELRQDLDIYFLISFNLGNINEKGIGKRFFGRIRQLAHISITLNICKIFEEEKEKGEKYELNSIQGVFQHLIPEPPTQLGDAKLRDFIRKYQGPSDQGDLISALKSTINGFRDKFKVEIDRFKEFRNKKAAHSEYNIAIENLPSYDVMESLFLFGADFYNLISAGFVGVTPYDFRTGRRVKVSLRRLLQELGLKAIKTDMESVVSQRY
jgi:hypothetical protein